jgi:NADH-quinone oxidoreductase subunit J
MEGLLFYAFGGLAVAASLLVVGQRNPMYSILLLIMAFAALAGLYIQLEAPFVAVIQIIIYAGAIMVLFLFVVMLLNAGRDEPAPVPPRVRRLGLALTLLLAAELGWVLLDPATGGTAAIAGGASVSSVAEIGRRLFTDYAFAFEVTSILILVAMLGAVVLARREGVEG